MPLEANNIFLNIFKANLILVYFKEVLIFCTENLFLKRSLNQLLVSTPNN